jgi:hypothetical protein
MTVMFSDGFESGDLSAWTGTHVANGLTPSVMKVPFKGIYSARFLTNPTLDLARSQVYVRTDMTDIYVRGYFYVQQGITALQRNDRFYLLRLLGPDNNPVALIGPRRDGDQPARWCLWTRKTTTPFTGDHVYGTTIITEADQGRWICVEIHFNRATGLYEVWIDGRLEVTRTVTPGDLTSVTSVQVGIYKVGATGVPYDPTGEYTIEVYGDNIVIADKYIGPEAPPTPPPTIWPVAIVLGMTLFGIIAYALGRRR